MMSPIEEGLYDVGSFFFELLSTEGADVGLEAGSDGDEDEGEDEEPPTRPLAVILRVHDDVIITKRRFLQSTSYVARLKPLSN